MIKDGRAAATAALCACALLAAALAPSAGASLQASVDAGGLVLTDVTGSADDVTLSTNKTGLFVALADKADALDPVCPLASPKFHGFQCAPAPLVRIDSGAGNDRIDALAPGHAAACHARTRLRRALRQAAPTTR